MPHVAHDADDGAPGARVGTADADVLPEWILVGKNRARGLLADEHDLLRASPIGVGEQPAALQRNLHHGEIVRRDGVALDGWILGTGDAALYVEAPAVAVATERDLSGHRGRLHSRQRA